MAQTLNEIVGRIAGTSLRNSMINWQKYFEWDSLIGFKLVRTLFHIWFSWILAQCTQTFANLVGRERETKQNKTNEIKIFVNKTQLNSTIHHFFWRCKKKSAYLIQLNFTIATIVKQIEGLLKFCNGNEKKTFRHSIDHQSANRNFWTGLFLPNKQFKSNNNLLGIAFWIWATFNRIKNTFGRWIVHIHDLINWSLSLDSLGFLSVVFVYCTCSNVCARNVIRFLSTYPTLSGM